MDGGIALCVREIQSVCALWPECCHAVLFAGVLLQGVIRAARKGAAAGTSPDEQDSKAHRDADGAAETEPPLASSAHRWVRVDMHTAQDFARARTSGTHIRHLPHGLALGKRIENSSLRVPPSPLAVPVGPRAPRRRCPSSWRV